MQIGHYVGGYFNIHIKAGSGDFIVSFTTLRHFSGNFGRSQLTYPHCSWASLLGSLPVLSAHYFASNWQMPFLNQQNGNNCPFWISGRERMTVEIIVWPIFTKECCRTWGSNPLPSHNRRTRIRSSYRARLRNRWTGNFVLMQRYNYYYIKIMHTRQSRDKKLE